MSNVASIYLNIQRHDDDSACRIGKSSFYKLKTQNVELIKTHETRTAGAEKTKVKVAHDIQGHD